MPTTNKTLGRFWKPGDIWKSDEWHSMGFSEIPTSDGPYWEIAMLFQTKNYAEQVYAAISDWQNEHVPPMPGVPQDYDRQNAIQLSFIIEDDGSYSTYVYPSLVGVPVSSEIQTITICKGFPGYAGSHLERFAKAYKGQPFMFAAFHRNGNNPQPVTKTNPIWKTHVKIKRRSELLQDEFEYMHGKRVMGL